MTEARPGPDRSDDLVVSLRGIGKRFEGAGGGTVALEDVDLDVRRGELVTLIGPSGCGKTTLLRVVADLTEPSTGTVVVGGRTPERARLDRAYGMVFQAPVLFDWRTVEDNVALPLEVLGHDAPRRAARVGAMLDLVELAGFARHRPYELSGGMQQRVAIARALATEPAILLMDEPFGALDEMTRERLNGVLLRIQERTGTTILFVTHSIAEAVFLSSRVVVMRARPGRIAGIVDVDLPRPRDEGTRELPRYYELVTIVREALRAGDAGDRGADGGD